MHKKLEKELLQKLDGTLREELDSIDLQFKSIKQNLAKV